MSFKEGLKKVLGIKSEEEIKKQKTQKEKTKEFFESLLFAAIAAFFIITFIVQNTRIPTGSMEDTILVGDFVLVNKFITLHVHRCGSRIVEPSGARRSATSTSRRSTRATSL